MRLGLYQDSKYCIYPLSINMRASPSVRFKKSRAWTSLHQIPFLSSLRSTEHGFAELCFQCDCWFNDSSEWERHCQEHLDKPEELLRCDPLIFRNFPVKPGYCCFCLGNTRQSASKRMEQYVTDRSKWYDHIECHLNKLGCDFSCSHPACCVEFQNVKDLRDHLVDVHCYQPPRGRKRTWNESQGGLVTSGEN